MAIVAVATVAGGAHADAKKPPVSGKKAPAPVKPTEPEAPAPAPPTTEAKPWAQGVSTEDQRKAEAIFADANALFAEQSHPAALLKYREALAVWNHPLIRFNMAVTLIRLDRVIEAADELDRSLAYGAQPFSKELYQQALDYKALLAGRIGELDVSCDQPETTILLDGKHWFDCPKAQKQRIMAGEHTIVGERRGYLTASKRVVVAGGKTAKESISLVSLDAAVTLEYRYRRWIPWTITGVGVAVALGGVGFYFAGKSQMDEFDQNFARECTITGCEKGLTEHPSLRAQQESAILKRNVGLSMLVAGGAVTIGGIVMTILNRPHRVLPHVEVAPTAGGAAVSTAWSW